MEDTDSKDVKPAPAWLKRPAPKWFKALFKLLVWFGVLSRIVFIPVLAVFVYQLIDPHGVLDIPFAELTFGTMFESLFTWLFIIFCVVWFFKFPKKDDYWLIGIGYSKSDQDKLQVRAVEDVYLKWSRYGVLVLIIIILIYWIK